MGRVKDHFHDEICARAFDSPGLDPDELDKSIIGGYVKNRGYNMGLCSGIAVYPLDLRPEDIHLNDVAASLARICRFNGHLADHVGHYSVAQHSVHVSLLVEAELLRTGDYRLHTVRQALLHDASEYIVGDMVRPLKVTLDGYNAVERKVWTAVAARFGVPALMIPIVKWADNVALCTELRDIRNPNCQAAKGGLLPPDPTVIIPLDSLDARNLFLARAAELGIT